MNRNDISLTTFPFHGVSVRVTLDAPATGPTLADVAAAEQAAWEADLAARSREPHGGSLYTDDLEDIGPPPW